MPGPLIRNGSLSLRSDPVEVERLLNELGPILDASCLDQMSAFKLQSAIVEVINNCIQHAYRNQAGQPIEISYELGIDRVKFEILDCGPEFRQPEHTPAASTYSESGRGLGIINAWVTGLRFERVSGWNICHLEQRNP
jgi:anti-sigma regulatory factor (Ser/Thr protein kinase)